MLPQRRGGQFYSKLEMNNSLDYLNIDIPSNWNKDQNSWTLNKSECMSNMYYMTQEQQIH